MVRYLSNYNHKYKIFTVSKSKEYTDYLLQNGLDVGVLTDDHMTLLPDNIVTDITESEKNRMQIFNEGDILEIGESGIIYRWYSSLEGDAGIATTCTCNSNCIMCPASESERKQINGIKLENIFTVLEHMPKDLCYFTITGGEPTLIGEENFIKVLENVKKNLPLTKILLLTNGRTLGDRSFFEYFVKSKPDRLRVAIPIHGSTEKRHDYITQANGSFAQTLRGISNLLKAGIELEIRIVVSKLNCDDITAISKLIIEFFPNVSVVNFVGLEMRGNCVVNSDKVLLSYQDAFKSSVEGINQLVKNGINVGLYNFPYCMIDKNYWPIAQKSISSYKSVFYKECENCKLMNECCGIFKATMDYYKPEVYPIFQE